MDEIILDTKQSIEELKQYKQALITETVTKGINNEVEMKHSKIEWIGKLRYIGISIKLIVYSR